MCILKESLCPESRQPLGNHLYLTKILGTTKIRQLISSIVQRSLRKWCTSVLLSMIVMFLETIGWIFHIIRVLGIIGILFSLATFIRFASIKYTGPIVFSFLLTSEIPLSYLAQVLFFGLNPGLKSVLGAIFITITQCFCQPSPNTSLFDVYFCERPIY